MDRVKRERESWRNEATGLQNQLINGRMEQELNGRSAGGFTMNFSISGRRRRHSTNRRGGGTPWTSAETRIGGSNRRWAH
jgi:hypothetical protein